MDNFRALIRAESKTLRELHKEIHRLLPTRNKSKWGFQKWADACSRFHQYQSDIDRFLTDDAFEQLRSCDPIMIEFTLEFLEEDPIFFRSGYLKEYMLHILKQVQLSKSQIQRLREILLDAVERRGGREFRRYCRLVRIVVNAKFEKQLQELQLSTSPDVSSRASMMRTYLKT